MVTRGLYSIICSYLLETNTFFLAASSMAMPSLDKAAVDFIQSPGCIKLVVRLELDSKPVQTSILKNYDDVVLDDHSSLVLPTGLRDSESVAWVAANTFGCDGMGMGQLAQVVKVSKASLIFLGQYCSCAAVAFRTLLLPFPYTTRCANAH